MISKPTPNYMSKCILKELFQSFIVFHNLPLIVYVYKL